MTWIGAVITLFLLIVWVGSGWFICGAGCVPTLFVQVCDGVLRINWMQGVQVRGDWKAFPIHFHGLIKFIWWFGVHRSAVSAHLDIPLWTVVLLTGVPTYLIWRRDRRARRSGPATCPQCGYDLTGLPSGGDHACPECGTPA